MLELVGMIYKNPEFLRSMWAEMNKYLPHGVTVRVVANDPLESVERAAEKWKIPLDVYYDNNPKDFYLHRINRCYNFCVETSTADYVCLFQSDMITSPNWLHNLMRRIEGGEKVLPVSRLIEPCKHRPLRVCAHGIEMDLGRHPLTFPFEIWDSIVAQNISPETKPGGGYMPAIVHRKTFLDAGGFPEGNVIEDDGKIEVISPEDYSKFSVHNGKTYYKNKPHHSGDSWLFKKLEKDFGFKHVTCFDSLVYHMQEGEMVQ